MNYTRLALAAIAATLADFVYGFVVYGNILTSSFLAQAWSTARASWTGLIARPASLAGWCCDCR